MSTLCRLSRAASFQQFRKQPSITISHLFLTSNSSSISSSSSSSIGRSYFSLRDIFEPDYNQQQQSSHDYFTTSDNKILPRAKYINGKYISPWTGSEKKLGEVVKFLLGWNSSSEKENRVALDKANLNVVETLSACAVDIDSVHAAAELNRATLTWMGHATTYYQTDGVYFLTDPVFSERASFTQYAGPKRFLPPPIELDKLKVDVVLLSHTHYDHYDLNSAKQIGNKALWIVPLGVKEMLADAGITSENEVEVKVKVKFIL